MLGVTRLLCGTATPGDALRFGRQSGQLPPHLLHYSQDKKPVVVWNVTRTCNLHCVHCYADSHGKEYEGELTTEEALRVIDDLAQFGAPVILFSGGEPLLRPDLFQLIRYAKDKGIRGVLSTNGTLITREVVRQLKEFGLSYVGVSIDGPEHIHDRFRGKKGAFQEALQGIRNCLSEDILTVDNHTDGVYLYLRARREQPERAEEIYRMLKWNGGNQSGVAVADIDPLGNVHADQFWSAYTFGNVRQRPFSQIWTDTADAVMAVLKDRRGRIKGKCSRCPYFEICNGNLRVRAWSCYGDMWAEDPACYLSHEELGVPRDETTVMADPLELMPLEGKAGR